MEMSEKLLMIRTISNRLAGALAILVAMFIPGAVYAYLNPGDHLISAPVANFVMGIIGGFVGLQRRLKAMSNDDLMLLAHSWVYVCLSPLVGGILAIIIYILFISGLLAGDLFPKFVPDEQSASAPVQQTMATIFAIHGSAADYAKMLFWCFVAGFSERFVVDTISRFESQSLPKSEDSA